MRILKHLLLPALLILSLLGFDGPWPTDGHWQAGARLAPLSAPGK